MRVNFRHPQSRRRAGRARTRQRLDCGDGVREVTALTWSLFENSTESPREGTRPTGNIRIRSRL